MLMDTADPKGHDVDRASYAKHHSTLVHKSEAGFTKTLITKHSNQNLPGTLSQTLGDRSLDHPLSPTDAGRRGPGFRQAAGRLQFPARKRRTLLRASKRQQKSFILHRDATHILPSLQPNPFRKGQLLELLPGCFGCRRK